MLQVCSSSVTASEEWDGFNYLSLEITRGSLLEPERKPIYLGVHRFAKEWISERKKNIGSIGEKKYGIIGKGE